MNPSSLPLTIKLVRPHYKVIGPAVMDHDRAHYDVDHGPSAEALRQELWFRTQEREAYGPIATKLARVHRVRKVR